MTAAAVPNTRVSVAAERRSAWRTALPVLLVVLAQVAVFVWLSPRGFEFTDESYYLLNLLYWRELIGTVTFFGAWFEWPFRLLGESVAAIRVFGLLSLLGCGAYFAHEAVRFFDRRGGWRGAPRLPEVAFVATGMAAALLYYGGALSTLRVPSYNLLALCSILVATGLMLRLLEAATPQGARAAALGWGFAVCICALAKVPSAALLIVCHVAFFLLGNRDWRSRWLAELLVLSLAGASVDLVFLQAAHPEWQETLREGIAMAAHDSSHQLPMLVNGLRWDVQRQFAPILAPALVATAAFAWVARRLEPGHRPASSIVIGIIVVACALVLTSDRVTRQWLPLTGLAAILLWTLEAARRRPFQLGRGDIIDMGLMGLLFMMPVAFSFGTNNNVLEHSQAAGIFVVTALVLRLRRLGQLGIVRKTALVACLSVLCIPALVIQLQAAWQVDRTYRQSSALGDQSLPVRFGAADDTLLVDAPTRETLRAVIGAGRDAGLQPGHAVLDFTGDGPGLVYALGARPVGLAWLLGGYPESANVAARVIQRTPVETLRCAWLLSSRDNPRAIGGWEQLLDARLGKGAHELVADVRIQPAYWWGTGSRAAGTAPQTIGVQLWKPRCVAP